MSREGVDIIDLSYAAGDAVAERKAAGQISAALARLGFFVVTGHGIDTGLLGEVDRIGREFFDLPQDEKIESSAQVNGIPRGFVAQGKSALGRTIGQATPADIKESFVMGPELKGTGDEPAASQRFYVPNRWPSRMPAMKPLLCEFYESMERLSFSMLRLFAISLDLEPEYFSGYFSGHNSTLRVIHYPPMATPPLPGQLRAGEHTDFGAFTILMSENASGGLQVRTRQGEWIDIVSPPGSFVVNVGDMMMRWTNDKWLSNMHRVAIPASEVAGSERRQSIVYFVNPNESAIIECLPSCRSAGTPALYEPIEAGEYRLRQNLKTSGLMA